MARSGGASCFGHVGVVGWRLSGAGALAMGVATIPVDGWADGMAGLLKFGVSVERQAGGRLPRAGGLDCVVLRWAKPGAPRMGASLAVKTRGPECVAA